MRRALVIVALLTVTGCQDRERINCPRTKNQVLTRTTFEPTTTRPPVTIGERCA